MYKFILPYVRVHGFTGTIALKLRCWCSPAQKTEGVAFIASYSGKSSIAIINSKRTNHRIYYMILNVSYN